jgi:hypothetical protein|tara:strand:- start:397 stop:696 length:300 start_codon:yes stop_codon:yes gene_type:complete
MGFDMRSLDLSDMVRSSKQGVKVDTDYGSSAVINEEEPLKGITSEQRNRNRNIGDVLNIGAGTRCVHCGFLHFLWRASCGSCEKPMDYNLGDRDEKNRL